MKGTAARDREPAAAALAPKPGLTSFVASGVLEKASRVRLQGAVVASAAARHPPSPPSSMPVGAAAIVSFCHEEGGATRPRPQREESSRTPGRARPRPGASTRAYPYIVTDERTLAIRPPLRREDDLARRWKRRPTALLSGVMGILRLLNAIITCSSPLRKILERPTACCSGGRVSVHDRARGRQGARALGCGLLQESPGRTEGGQISHFWRKEKSLRTCNNIPVA
jgi:hypothetical protein